MPSDPDSARPMVFRTHGNLHGKAVTKSKGLEHFPPQFGAGSGRAIRLGSADRPLLVGGRQSVVVQLDNPRGQNSPWVMSKTGSEKGPGKRWSRVSDIVRASVPSFRQIYRFGFYDTGNFDAAGGVVIFPPSRERKFPGVAKLLKSRQLVMC